MIDVTNYTDKITMFLKKGPKFVQTVGESLQPTVDVENLLNELYSYFDLDTAIGAQLDVVGQWINLSRVIQVHVPDPWFRWGDAARGWGTGIWKQPYDSGTHDTALDDDMYRRLLKARIKVNQWDGTSGSAQEILDSYFNYVAPDTYVIVDDKNIMQLIYGMSGKIPDNVSLEIFSERYLPLRTSGVRTYYFVTSVDNTPLFGWGLDNTKIGGWGSGAWGVPPLDILNAL